MFNALFNGPSMSLPFSFKLILVLTLHLSFSNFSQIDLNITSKSCLNGYIQKSMKLQKYKSKIQFKRKKMWKKLFNPSVFARFPLLSTSAHFPTLHSANMFWLLRMASSIVRGMFDFVEKLEMHSVSKFHFWSKKSKFLKSFVSGQFLFLCQSWLF